MNLIFLWNYTNTHTITSTNQSISINVPNSVGSQKAKEEAKKEAKWTFCNLKRKKNSVKNLNLVQRQKEQAQKLMWFIYFFWTSGSLCILICPWLLTRCVLTMKDFYEKWGVSGPLAQRGWEHVGCFIWIVIEEFVEVKSFIYIILLLCWPTVQYMRQSKANNCGSTVHYGSTSNVAPCIDFLINGKWRENANLPCEAKAWKTSPVVWLC